PEPYFVTIFLVDINDGRRVSEDFYWNPNSSTIDSMLSIDQFKHLPWFSSNNTVVNNNNNQNSELINNTNDQSVSHQHQPIASSNRGVTRRPAPPPPLPTSTASAVTSNLVSPYGTQNSITLDCLTKCRSALFSIPSTYPVNSINNNNLYIVVRVDKVFSGSINTIMEKYLKNTGNITTNTTSTTTNNNNMSDNLKLGSTIHKSMINYCRNIGRYRMPFAWGTRPLNSSNRFIHLFKMDANKIPEQGLIQSVQMCSRLFIDYTNNSNNSSVASMVNCTTTDNDISSTVNESILLPFPESINRLFNKLDSNQSKLSKIMNHTHTHTHNNDFMNYLTEHDRLLIDSMERSLKTQWLPLRFELVMSELLMNQHDHSNLPVVSR
ncbi:unnamed protein product, partial [Schistosoma turkestanicum]